MSFQRKYLVFSFLLLTTCCSLAQNNIESPVFTSLDSIIKTPEKVISISLRKKKLKEFPSEILFCKNLKYLDLSSNRIKEIPLEISELQYLEKLIISNNNLSSLPVTIGNLQQLKYLDASRNGIDSLPHSFGNLTQLETLILWSNFITEFPESMQNADLKLLDIRAISMNPREQKAIFLLFPNAEIKCDRPCNCR